MSIGRSDRRAADRRRGGFRPILERFERRLLLTTYAVTTTDDSGPGSLREAITEADAKPGPDAIRFDIPASDAGYDRRFQTWTIKPTSALPAITDSLEIDGYSQKVNVPILFNETQTISANGSPTGTFTLSFEGATTTPMPVNAPPIAIQSALEHLPTIGAGNVVVQAGPLPGAPLFVVFQGDLGMLDVPPLVLGTSGVTGGTLDIFSQNGGFATGQTQTVEATPNTLPLSSNAHIRIILDGSQTGGATGLTIAASHSQVFGLAIDGFGTGIDIKGAGNVGNTIQGDAIGRYVVYPNPILNFSLDSFLEGTGNSGEGIRIETTNNMVGGFLPGARNTIAGNGLQGVHILPGADGNQLFGNLIGIATQDATLYYIGPDVGNGAEGVLVESSSNLIGEPVTGATNIISENHAQGVRIIGPSALSNSIQGNFIGSDPAGTLVLGKQKTGNFRDGILIENAPNTRIGGPTLEARNVVIANGWGDDSNPDAPDDGWSGIRIVGPAATSNIIQGNNIGVDLAGSLVVPNSGDGVFIASAGNVVGGADPGDRNIISGNRRGVRITRSPSFGSSGTGNLVLGNYIGTDLTGEADLGNTAEGVRIDDVTGNTIGGTAKGAGNVISGNDVGVGINRVNAPTSGNLILGNLIGTDALGTRAIPNSKQGVLIDSAPDNTIGGAAAGSGNTISGNHWGLVIQNSGATGNLAQGNMIGTDLSGAAPLGNEVDGVRIINGAARNIIGGFADGAGNIIAFNQGNGVTVGLSRGDTSAVGNAILTNRIFANTGLGIDLGNDGPTPNSNGGGGTGPNNLQNAPVLTSVATSVAFTSIGGTLQGRPNATYLIQYFAGGSANGQAERFLGQSAARTDATGVANFTGSVPGNVPAGQFVTATATDMNGDTSEFARGISEVLGTVQFQMAGYVVSEGAGMAVLVVTRQGGSGGLFTIDYATSGGTATSGQDFVPVAGTLTFQPGQSSQIIAVPIIDDTLPEATETFNVTLSHPTGAAQLGSPAVATVAILDNDQPGTLRFESADAVVNEAQGFVTLTVVRDSGGGNVTVNYATADGTAMAGSDYVATAGTLTFLPGQTQATITVPVLDDNIIEGTETFHVNLANPTGGAVLGAPSTATVSILDDTRDRTGPRIIAVEPIPARRTVPGIVLTFNEPLTPATARDLANYSYSVQIAGPHKRPGGVQGQLVGLRAAIYDPAHLSVTLIPASVIHRGLPILVQVDAATGIPGTGQGITDLAGNLLDGDGNGVPGGSFQIVIVASPVSTAPVAVRRVVPIPGARPRPVGAWSARQPAHIRRAGRMDSRS